MIFISHSSKDKAAALDIQQRLLGYGYDASQLFLDSDAETGIAAGSKWEQVLYARLKDCRALIVLCSANWQESRWCFAELVFAKAMGKEIFPVLLQECSVDQLAAEHQAVFVYKEGEAAYARLWKALDNRHLGPRDDFGWPPNDEDHCPFPGLPAFDERFAGVFFGRESETQTILEDLRKMRTNGEPRFLMIVGGSGSGKSSLLKAGVLPRLKHKTVDTEWVILPTLRYGEQANEQRTIFDQLTVNVAELFPIDSKSMPDWKLLRAQLFDDDVKLAVKTFVEILQDLTLARNRSDATVLIAIDQFEELLVPSAGPMAAKLLRFLRELLHCRSGQLLVIGTMRSDHLDNYEQSSNALPAPYFQSWRLGPFPSERIAEVIRKPADRAHVAITDELVDRLKRDTPTAEALPLLAFTLEKLYRGYESTGKLELQGYVSLGGMEGSIQTCIERIVPRGSLSAIEAASLRLTFVKHLAQVNDKGEVVRLMARWDDVPAAAKPILEKFVNERLLVRSENKDEGKLDRPWVSIEVAHEAMFRCWKDLKEWLRTSADVLRWRRDVRRDQANDPKWTGLRAAQLAVARDWPIRRRDELSKDEMDWINRGILWQRIRQGIVASVVLVVALFAAIAWWQRNEADNATRGAQHALTNSFFRTIGVSSDDDLPRDEREALWELARLDRANSTVREYLLKRWFETGEAFKRGEAGDGQGFRAAIGLNMEFNRLAVIGRAELSRHLLATLEDPQETDSDRLSHLGSALAALAAKMEPRAAAEISRKGYQRLVVALENSKETRHDHDDVPSPDAVPDEAIDDALADLRENIEPQAATEIAKGLAAALENPKETDSTRLFSLGSALADMADRMKPYAAAQFPEGLAAAMETSKETDSVRLLNLGDAMVHLMLKMETQADREIARRGATRIAAALENTQETVSDHLSRLHDDLQLLAGVMEPQATAAIAKGLAAALENTQETASVRLSSLGNTLADLAARMAPEPAALIARGLAAVLENPRVTNQVRLSNVALTLEALAVKMKPQAAAAIAKGLAAVLENPQETDSVRLLSLGLALGKLATRMESKTTEAIAEGVAAALENPQETSFNRLSNLGYALALLAPEMKSQQAAAQIARRGAERVAVALENPQETSFNRLSNLGYVLAALATKMEPQAAAEIARRVAPRVATVLENPQETDSDSLSTLGDSLALLAEKMRPQTAAAIAEGLAVVLENPLEKSTKRLMSLDDSLEALAVKMEPQAAAVIAKGLAAALENPLETSLSRLSSLGRALATIATKMEQHAAAGIAKGLTVASENPQQTDTKRLYTLGSTLAAFCALLPSAHQTHLLALSNLLLSGVFSEEDEPKQGLHDRKRLAAVCAQLSPQDLTEVLKYPFCTGEAEQMVLNELERMTSRKFGGDVWKFVAQADALGIKDIDSPAKRPSVADALKELDAL